jgi:hypothetical protein
MKLAGLLLAAIAATPIVTPEARYFRYERPIKNVNATASQDCFALDTKIFEHSTGLADLRIYRDAPNASSEVAYAPMGGMRAYGEAHVQIIEPLNLGKRGGRTVFDAKMPDGAYADVDLTIAAQDFQATVEVTGSQGMGDSNKTKLGDFTIFDLTGQRLGRSTVLHLPRSDFRFLHFSIAGPIAPTGVSWLRVDRPPAQLQPRYVTVSASTSFIQKDHVTQIEFKVPPHMPVDRIVFEVGAQPASFSRQVIASITITNSPQSKEQPMTEDGNILRVHRLEMGHRIDDERLTIVPPYGSYLGLNTESDWMIQIENGDDPPIQLNQVRLEMLERGFCFAPVAGATYVLMYGDPELPQPRYDYALLFTEQTDAARASLGPEQVNPSYEARPDPRPFTEKHPALLWAALILVIAVLGFIALRSMKRVQATP